MIHEQRPMSPELALEHFGIKGMKWGHTTAEASSGPSAPKQPMSTKKKVAIGVGVAVIVGVGLIAGNAVLKQHGMSLLDAKKVLPSSPRPAVSSKVTAVGRQAASALQQKAWDASVKVLEVKVKTAHEEQTAYMRKEFRRLGGQYNPRSNPYTPEARLAIGR
jgi:hypothetical protein